MTGVQEDPIVTGKAKEAIKLIALILLIVVVGIVTYKFVCLGNIIYATDGDAATEGHFADEIPTVVEFQTLLVEKGYDIGIDGIDGVPGPNTIGAWKLAINNQHNAKYYYMYEEVKK